MLGRVNYSTVVNLIEFELGKDTKSKLKMHAVHQNQGLVRKSHLNLGRANWCRVETTRVG